MNAEDLARGLGGESKSAGGWVARCPAHEDQRASLSLTDRDGRVLWKCHAGCSQRDVFDALKQRGLAINGRRRDVPVCETPEQAARRLAAPALRDGFTFEALFAYTDAKGALVFWRIRAKHPANGQKWIRPMQRTARGYELGEPVFPKGRPLYGLKDIARAPIEQPVLIVEGENKVDALRRIGLLATTSGGAASANGADWSVLKDRPCPVWPDFDDAGFRYARDVTAKVRAAGGKVAAWIDVVKLGIQPGDDAVDWLEAHPNATAGDVLALPLVNELPDLAAGEQPQGAAPQADQEPQWEQPHDLISRVVSQPYPLDALPGAIGEAVREVVEFVQCPASLAAMSALAVVSLSGQALADVRRASKLCGPSSLYFLAIADSGERKSTCDNFFSTVVRECEEKQAEAARPDIAAQRTALNAWQHKCAGVLDAIKTAAKKGAATADHEKALASLETQKPRPIRQPRLRHMDTTPESLAWNLSRPDAWPSGAVLSSEAGIVFGGHGMGRDSVMRNLALLNMLWDGVTLKVDRKTSESFTLSGARLSMGLAVQPDVVRAFFDSTKGLARGSGFAARFLIAWPESTQGSRRFKQAPDRWPSLARFHRRIGELLNQTPKINDRGELEPVMLDLSAGAHDAWAWFHDEVELELRPGGDMDEMKDVSSKAADNAARLAALFHLFEAGAAGKISEQHMRAACRIVAWHLYEARRFFDELALPPARSNAVKLDAWIVRYCRDKRTASLSRRTIQREGPAPVRDRQALDRALEELVEAGRVQERRDGRQRLLHVNPALLEVRDGAA